MNLSPAGLDFIKEWERFRPTAYKDVRGIWTIGYGHTAGVKEGDTCTLAQGLIWLAEDTVIAQREVMTRVHVPMSQNQFDALVSLVFNIGSGNFEQSQVLRAMNKRNVWAASDGFLHFTRAGSKRKALQPRREAEQALFLKAG